MKDTSLYAQLLGLAEPWFVENVEPGMTQNSVDIWLNHREGAEWKCPVCGEDVSCHDHVAERQ